MDVVPDIALQHGFVSRFGIGNILLAQGFSLLQRAEGLGLVVVRGVFRDGLELVNCTKKPLKFLRLSRNRSVTFHSPFATASSKTFFARSTATVVECIDGLLLEGL